MINFVTVLFSLLALTAIAFLVYYLLILHVVAPRILSKCEEGDLQYKMWIAKIGKIRQQKLIMIYAIGLAFSLFVLGWAIIQIKVLKVPY